MDNPINQIRQYKAAQAWGKAVQSAPPKAIVAREVGYDATQGKAVIETDDGGQVFAESITNGYRGPNQAVRLNQAGNFITADSMPRPKRETVKKTERKVYGKLKILYLKDGVLWIGGDRATPKKLKTNIDPQLIYSFNNLGDGDKYVVTGKAKDSTAVISVLNDKAKTAPNFTSPDVTAFPITIDPGSFFLPPIAKGHGFFANYYPARYWYRDRHADLGASDPQNHPTFIYPDETRTAFSIPSTERPGATESSDDWKIWLASKNLEATLVNRLRKPSIDSSLIYEIYVYRNGALTQLYTSIGATSSSTPTPLENISLFSYVNWVGQRAYSLVLENNLSVQAAGTYSSVWAQRSAVNLDYTKDRQCWITVAREGAAVNGFVKQKDIRTYAYKIPKGSQVLAMSYHP